MSSEKDQIESSVASDGYADDGLTPEERRQWREEIATWPSVTPEEASEKTGLPVSFFKGTWRDDPEYMAKYVTPYVK